MVAELLVLSQAGEVDAAARARRPRRTPRAAPRRAGTAPSGGSRASSDGDAGRRLRPARRPRPRARRAGRERDRTTATARSSVRSRPARVEVLDRGPGLADERAGRGLRALPPRRAPAAPGRTAPASGCRSRASWRAAGAATSTLANRDGGGARAIAARSRPFPALNRRAGYGVRMRRATLLWVLLAVGGVLLVAGVTLAASTLSTQSIGLSSEPLSAGDELSPQGDRDAAGDAPPTRSAARRAASAHARGAGPTRARARAERDAATPQPAATRPPRRRWRRSTTSTTTTRARGRTTPARRRRRQRPGRGRGRGRGGDDDD